jgi:hypothetical protein
MKWRNTKQKVNIEQTREAARLADFINNPPQEYKPQLDQSSMGGRQGYVDERGMFFEGGYDHALKKKWKWDLMFSQAKMNDQKKEQTYRSSMKRHIDDMIKDIGGLKNATEDSIKKGRKWLGRLIAGN